jgi:hypothetical protein
MVKILKINNMKTKYNIDILGLMPTSLLSGVSEIIMNHNSGVHSSDFHSFCGWISSVIFNTASYSHLYVTTPENFTIVVMQGDKPVLTITEVEIFELENTEA